MWYADRLRRAPMLTNAVTASGVMVAGDIAAQRLEGNRKLVWQRTAVLASFNSGFGAPFFTLFWRALENRVPGQRIGAAVTKAILTSLIANPIMNGMFFTYSTALEHAILPSARDQHASVAEAIKAQLREKYFRTLQVSAMVWVPINTANFALVPPHMRVVVAQTCAVVWAAYLSLVQHRSTDTGKADSH